jgi:hypothetical protein
MPFYNISFFFGLATKKKQGRANLLVKKKPKSAALFFGA